MIYSGDSVGDVRLVNDHDYRLHAFRRDWNYRTAFELMECVLGSGDAFAAPKNVDSVDAIRDWLASELPPGRDRGIFPEAHLSNVLDDIRTAFLDHRDRYSAMEYLTWLILLRDDNCLSWSTYSHGLSEIRDWLRRKAEGWPAGDWPEPR